MERLAQANAEIRDAERRDYARKAAQTRVRRPIFLVDRLLGELEELNLRAVRRVPLSWAGRLDAIREQVAALGLPSGYLRNLRVRLAVVTVMDALYAVQEALLAQQRGALRPAALRLTLVPLFDRSAVPAADGLA